MTPRVAILFPDFAAIVLANVVVVLADSIEAGPPMHTMTYHPHTGIVVGEIAWGEGSNVLGVSALVCWTEACRDPSDRCLGSPMLSLFCLCSLLPLVSWDWLDLPLLERDLDFLRGLPSESCLEDSSISSGSFSDFFSLSLDDGRLDRDLVLSSVADGDSSSLSLAFLVSGFLGLSFGDTGLFFPEAGSLDGRPLGIQ